VLLVCALDEPIRHRVFGHYARLLVDLSKPLCNYILVEREGFAFHVGVVYEKHPEYCNNCVITYLNVTS
jgi:hypothetical protein